MTLSRRSLLSTAAAAAASSLLPSKLSAASSSALALPYSYGPHPPLSPAVVRAHYAQLDAILTQPVLKRHLFPDPVIIDTLELLHYKDSYLCRVRSRAGAVGISISNSNQMQSLYPIFVNRMQPFFPGRDARDLESLVEEVTVFQSNYKLQGTAIWVPLATIEFAILDMLGRMAGLPIGRLIGDIHNPQISVYQANGERGISPEETIEHLRADLDVSHAKAIKFKLGGRMSHPENPPDRSRRLIPMVRHAFGDDMVISADANGSYTPEQAIPIGRLMQQYNYAFFEEPVPFDWYEETRQVADALRIPIAGGEQEPSLHNFRWLTANSALSIVQPDMFYFGGMVRCMRVARMAHAMGRLCIPHISSSGLGYLYMMHFVSAIPNAGKYHEFKVFNRDLPFTCATSTLGSTDGVVKVPTGPGVGVDIDPAFLAKHSVMTS